MTTQKTPFTASFLELLVVRAFMVVHPPAGPKALHWSSTMH